MEAKKNTVIQNDEGIDEDVEETELVEEMDENECELCHGDGKLPCEQCGGQNDDICRNCTEGTVINTMD